MWFSLVLLPPLSFTVRYSVSTGHGTQAMAGNGRVHDAKGKLFLMGEWRWLLALLHFVTICHFMTTAEAEGEEWKFILKNVLTM